MFSPPRFVIIPTRNRWDTFRQCYDAIQPQVDRVIVINNGDEPAPLNLLLPSAVEIMDDEQPPNLSRLWNLGLDAATDLFFRITPVAVRRWDVAILNDDAIVPDGWFDSVSERMRGLGCAAGCSGGFDSMPVVQHKPGPVPLHTRMTGWAFIVAGEFGIRANEQLRWYFGDDHIDWLSRKAGGMVMIPGYHVKHLYPNGQMTAELHEQTIRDAAAFNAYWGMRPW